MRAALLLTLLAPCPASAQPADKYAAAVAEVQKLIEEEVADKNLPALSVALIDDQRVVWAKGFGFQDRAKTTPATADTVYRAGDISKLVTTAAALRLVDDGNLALDEPVSKYLPEFKPKTKPEHKPITPRMLLAHRSGLVREPPVGSVFDPTGPTLAATVASLNGVPVVYAPAERFKYSNAAFAVVGHALEKATGDPFASVVQKRVFDPLGMESSSFAPAADIRKRLADGTVRTFHGREFPAPTFEPGAAPARGMYSTVLDLAKFASSLFAGGPVPTPAEGWSILPREKLGVVVLCSRNAATDAISTNALRLMVAAKAGKPLPKVERGTPLPTDKPSASPPPEPPAKWKGLIGEYGWDHSTLYVFERGGKLHALIEWVEFAPLTELSESEFAFPDQGRYAGEKLTFARDAAGRASQVLAAGVAFPRRKVDGENGETFKIKAERPLEQLRKEALAAKPPAEAGLFLKPDLIDLATIEGIKFDIRYATTNNFLSTPFYASAKAYMQRPAALALERVQGKLKERGYGLLIHDAYRPWFVTKMFRDATPSKFHTFVADPLKGSRHNRGCAVDLALYDLKAGKPVEVVSGYDEFSDRAFPDYPGGTSRQRWHRDLLRRAMEAEGFTVYEEEWWHFDYKDWRKYPILNLTFEQLK